MPFRALPGSFCAPCGAHLACVDHSTLRRGLDPQTPDIGHLCEPAARPRPRPTLVRWRPATLRAPPCPLNSGPGNSRWLTRDASAKPIPLPRRRGFTACWRSPSPECARADSGAAGGGAVPVDLAPAAEDLVRDPPVDPPRPPGDDGADTITRNTAFALASQIATASFTAILTIVLVRVLGPGGLRRVRARAERRLARVPARRLRHLAVDRALRRRAPRRARPHRGGDGRRAEAEVRLLRRDLPDPVRARGADRERLQRARAGLAAARRGAGAVRPEHDGLLPRGVRGDRARAAEPAARVLGERRRSRRQHRAGAGRRGRRGRRLRPRDRLRVRDPARAVPGAAGDRRAGRSRCAEARPGGCARSRAMPARC